MPSLLVGDNLLLGSGLAQGIVIGTHSSPITGAEQDADNVSTCSRSAHSFSLQTHVLRRVVPVMCPVQAQVNEVQLIECECSGACTDEFVLKVLGYTSPSISPGLDASQLAALFTVGVVLRLQEQSRMHDNICLFLCSQFQQIPSINAVHVNLYGSTTTICDADGVTIGITFTNNPGNVPGMELISAGPTTTIVIREVPQRGTFGGKSKTGTRLLTPCSNRGYCDDDTGECTCYTGWTGAPRPLSPALHRLRLQPVIVCGGSRFGRGWPRGASW